jgi:indole-3-glycerol phosphate synthase
MKCSVMTNTLEKICADKREWIAENKQKITFAELESCAQLADAPRGFAKAIKAKATSSGVGLIAEIKKASPSKGLIRADFDPATLAKAYADGGAACLSVLTDIPYFQGDDSYLQQARAAVSLPVLRKDFMIDPYQIVEARALGADCILLIMAALSPSQAKELQDLARSYEMDVLLEVHDEAELETALTHLTPDLLGINNRSLKTLEVSLETSKRLKAQIPSNYTVVCESGIATSQDIQTMKAIGIDCFLVGESLMRQDDVALATRTLIHVAQTL